MTTGRDDHVDVDALGVTVRIALGALPETSRDALTAAWAGARPGSVAPPVEVVRPRTDLPLDAAVADVTTRVTLSALAARRGELWMVHAAAVADERGRVVLFSGRSGMGKTTLVTQVARRYAYVTDESVGVASDGGVLTYRKPLSVIETPAAPKRQVPPESLDLRPLPRAPLRLHAIVVLDRDDAHAPARLEALDIAETLGAVSPQSSYLAELDGPLQTVIRHIQAVGGAHRLRYRQAEEVIPLVDALFAAPRPETGDPIRPEPIVGTAHDTGFARSPVVDAVALDGGRLALLRRDADGQTSVHVVDGIGPTLWRAATGVAFDDLVSVAVDEHGVPDRGDAREAVRAALATLQESGLIEGPAESPARAGTGGTPGGELSRRVSGPTPGCDMDAMSQNDVTTRSNRGQWENAVEGRPELSASYSSREEAVDQGRATADELGSRHIVEDAEPTGAPTDEG